MAPSLRDALESYKAGRYSESLKRLEPLLKKRDPAFEAVLLAAQCCVRDERNAKAAAYYERAAGLNREKRRMFLTLSAGVYLRADDPANALRVARLAARGGPFDIEAEKVYRRALRAALAFDEWTRENTAFLERLHAGDPVALDIDSPFDALQWLGDEAIAARLTRVQNAAAFTPASRAARRSYPHRFGSLIRIGYLSNDVSDQHATMRLFQGVLMAHDRTRFDITLFCHTPPGILATDTGLRALYGRIEPIGHLSDADAAALIRSRNIDILVDLKGHTKDTRIDLLNLGLAPVQAAYLGYPGTGTGIDCDYAITDRIVTPDASKPYYHEKLCRLPETYQSNDDTHRALPPALTRAEAGLPGQGIVFASFNGLRKITPETVALWARILKAVEGSVLWILCDNDTARASLLTCFKASGIGADRVVFATAVAYPDHVARLQAADIGLDTFPYNGHTTTSDKLWAGLPVPTMRGGNFASRVSESLLTALGLPDLVAETPDAYVDLCVQMARDDAWRARLRETIAENRFRAPLFDTERFTRHLETAYTLMIERARAGLAPDHIDVPPLPSRTQAFGPGARAGRRSA